MIAEKILDYDFLCDELLKYYLEPEYYQATKKPMHCVTTKVTAATLDEYIKLLAEGYINVTLHDGLDQYLDLLLENECFHQWPLVRWAYASRKLHRKTNMPIKGNQMPKENTEYEIDILHFLAKEGWPNAIDNIGSIELLADNFTRSACLWIHAARRGYLTAGMHLFALLTFKEFESLCDEIQLLVLEGATSWYLEDNNATPENYRKTLTDWPLEKAINLSNQRDKLKAKVSQKMLMRETAGKLFWYNEDSPYSIKF